MIIGGLAVALLGRPRVTRDVDAVVFVEEPQWASFVATGEQYSFVPRLPEALKFARENRVLLLRHEKSGVDVDISLGGTQFEQQALARIKVLKIGKVALPLAHPEDLIVMKAVAQRDHDIKDIQGLFDVFPDLDVSYIRKWVDELAQALEMPEIYENLDRLILARKRKPG